MHVEHCQMETNRCAINQLDGVWNKCRMHLSLCLHHHDDFPNKSRWNSDNHILNICVFRECVSVAHSCFLSLSSFLQFIRYQEFITLKFERYSVNSKAELKMSLIYQKDFIHSLSLSSSSILNIIFECIFWVCLLSWRQWLLASKYRISLEKCWLQKLQGI